MSNLYVYTLFDHKTSHPMCAGIKDGENIVVVELYRKGTGACIADIHKNCGIIRRIIHQASKSGRSVILTDFKSHVKQFSLPIESRRYNVYDLHLPTIKSLGSQQQDHALVRRVLEKMEESTIHEYQKVLANAAVVYQDLEDNGLLMNYSPIKPVWSQKTFSGRSSTSGFNIQGHSDDDLIRPSGLHENMLLIHFDWICADIRAASLISEDKELALAFQESDPYIAMMKKLNDGATGVPMDRNECKSYLLKSINSMDVTSDALSSIYPTLGDWIGKCRKSIRADIGLETILKRRFRRSQAKNDLAVLNGIMQGSVAHAMQLVIRHVWEQIPGQIVAEIHDSLVVCSEPNQKAIRKTIDTVVDIMLHPFRDVLLDNPTFPLRISIGKRWKKWKMIYEYRDSGVKHVVE